MKQKKRFLTLIKGYFTMEATEVFEPFFLKHNAMEIWPPLSSFLERSTGSDAETLRPSILKRGRNTIFELK